MVGPEIARRLPYYKELKLNIYEITGIVLFTSGSFMANHLSKRPMSASLMKHVAFGVVGLFAGKQLAKIVEFRRNAKVLIIEDYIAKHPEDFPVVTPRKYKDVLLSWSPCR